MLIPHNSRSALPYWVALFLGIGSLLCYLTLAWFARRPSDDDENPRHDFNLGVPKGQDCSQLFATSLAAAGTPLSTVIAFFIMTAGTFGVRLLLCPLFFTLGVWLMYWVYVRTKNNGYFEQGTSDMYGHAGLLPVLGFQLTGSVKIGHILLVLCALPLLGLLTLEIAFGIQVIQYIATGALGNIQATTLSSAFGIFAIFVVLLLSYVFLGGFRAVIRSDVWQYKLLQAGIILTLGTLILWYVQRPIKPGWAVLWPSQKSSTLVGFYVPVVFVNLILPLGLVSSWQRFRAFDFVKTPISSAIWSGLAKTVILWCGLIVLSICAAALTIGPENSLPAFFDGIQAEGDFAQLFIFPLLVVAVLSAMYSCSDTCVSALLYLNEYRKPTGTAKSKANGLPADYYWTMVLILAATLMSYWFLKAKFSGSILAAPLFKIAVALYANLSVLAPTIFLTAFLKPARGATQKMIRSRYVLSSLGIGSAVFWGCVLLGSYSSLWSQCATIPALLFSSLPVWMLYRQEDLRRPSPITTSIEEYRL
jgi:hypothetical protein